MALDPTASLTRLSMLLVTLRDRFCGTPTQTGTRMTAHDLTRGTGAPARAAVATATAWRSRQPTVGRRTRQQGPLRPGARLRALRPGGPSWGASARSVGVEAPTPVRDWRRALRRNPGPAGTPGAAGDGRGARRGRRRACWSPRRAPARPPWPRWPWPTAVTGRVVIAQPRRVAARAAARRMAELLGERVGERVGYAVRGERKVGPGHPDRGGHHRPAGPAAAPRPGAARRRRRAARRVPRAATRRRPGAGLHRRGAGRPPPRTCGCWRCRPPRTPTGSPRCSAGRPPAPVITRRSALYPVQRSGRRRRARSPRRRAGRWIRPCSTTSPPPSGGRCRARRRRPGLPARGRRDRRRVAGRLADLRDSDVLPLHGRQPGASRTPHCARPARRRVVLATAVAETQPDRPGRTGRGRRRAGPRAADRPWPAGSARWSPCAVSRAAADPAGRPGRPGGPG